MVSTILIKPAPLLQPFVHCYSLRIFDSATDLPRPQYAQPEYYLTFFLKKDKYGELLDNSGKFIRKISNTLTTLSTESLGCLYFKGNFCLFSVQLKGNGLFAIFGIPQRILINAILPVEDILGNDNRLLTEQLESCDDVAEMGIYTNAYLTKKLLIQKHKICTTAIANISGNILSSKGLVSIDALALQANMSFRNFERRFTDEVGMPPKLYARITRFYNALENKMLHPYKRWVDITNENGYYDQAHFIKEVRAFSSKTPDELFKNTPPPTENFISKAER